MGIFWANFAKNRLILHSLDERVFDRQSAREISQWQAFNIRTSAQFFAT